MERVRWEWKSTKSSSASLKRAPRDWVWKEGRASLYGDLFKTDLSVATEVILCLSTLINQKLRPVLEKELLCGARVVAEQCEVLGWEPQEDVHEIRGCGLLRDLSSRPPPCQSSAPRLALPRARLYAIMVNRGDVVHPDLKAVIELQQVDLRIAELTLQIDSLPSQIQTLEKQLNDFLRAHEEHKQRLAANQKERKELEGEILGIKEKISKHKDQLYQVKTNEAYRAMFKEIEGEEANIRAIEDKVLENMIEAEELQKLVAEAAARVEGEKARVAAETRRLESLRRADVEERDQLAVRRRELEIALSEPVRTIYERVRKGRRGVALAEVRDGFCTLCNVRLRPQAYNEVRTNESILTCENCSRILYYVEPAPAAPADAGEKTNLAAL